MLEALGTRVKSVTTPLGEWLLLTKFASKDLESLSLHHKVIDLDSYAHRSSIGPSY